MISLDYCRAHARYNQWMNERLYAAAATLDDAQRNADCGAYFKSIHGTLNHLFYGDRAWLNRFKGLSLDGLAPDAALFDDFSALCAQRQLLDQELSDWVETLSTQWLERDFDYYSQAYGRSFTRPAWLLVSHLFNHQTHHRGQITTLLSQFGIDPGATDLPVSPQFDAP